MAHEIIGPNNPSPEKHDEGFHNPDVALMNTKYTTALYTPVY